MPTDDAVSLTEAARITGLSTDALRLRWRRGTLRGYKTGRRLFLYRASLPGTDRSATRSAEHITTERDRAEIALLREQIEVKDKQIAELHVLLGRLQERALPAPEASAQRRLWWRRWWS